LLASQAAFHHDSTRFVEAVKRGGRLADEEGALVLNEAIEKGRDGGFLNLTLEEYFQTETLSSQLIRPDILSPGSIPNWSLLLRI
jgi:hypothetical protein